MRWDVRTNNGSDDVVKDSDEKNKRNLFNEYKSDI